MPLAGTMPWLPVTGVPPVSATLLLSVAVMTVPEGRAVSAVQVAVRPV